MRSEDKKDLDLVFEEVSFTFIYGDHYYSRDTCGISIPDRCIWYELDQYGAGTGVKVGSDLHNELERLFRIKLETIVENL